jgi:hypothetical protein
LRTRCTFGRPVGHALESRLKSSQLALLELRGPDWKLSCVLRTKLEQNTVFPANPIAEPQAMKRVTGVAGAGASPEWGDADNAEGK